MSEEIARLQAEWLDRQASLFGVMLAAEAPMPDPGDRRFSAPEWSASPCFDYLRRAYLINADFMMRAAEALPLPDETARRRLRFFTRQYVDAMSPANFAATNPEVIRAALDSGGASITAGIRNLIADLAKGRITTSDETAFEVGRNLAVTPGRVVFENELIQVIQYAPSTARVFERPLLIVPPCINKFYVLDLRPENSLVRHAVERGMTVFMISWRNPREELGNLAWDDYLEKGILAALRAAREIGAAGKINALGYCIGGTLLASALSVARSRGEDPVASLTLLASLLDYSETGEIIHFIDSSMVAAREAAIGHGGLLRGAEMAAAFSALRANDLVWPYVVNNYLKGGTPPSLDLLYWNSDGTNLPGPFAVWYLRNLYLDNALRVPDRLVMCGTKVDLARLDMPAFLLATSEDHIVPWRTAYRSRGLLGGETTFVLCGSGHIAGVVNPPDGKKRGYWRNGANPEDADAWLSDATECEGSWWPAWIVWLERFAGRRKAARKRLGNREYRPMEPAPGRYVKEKI